jgi:hypothetical protein
VLRIPFSVNVIGHREIKEHEPRNTEKKRPVTNAKEVAVENRAEETYYHRTLSLITEPIEKR